MWKMAHGMFDPDVTMNEKYPGIPDPTPIPPPERSSPQISTLPNGVRVVSQDMGGLVSSIAVFVGAGSRDENPLNTGVSHLLERLAFKGSGMRSKFRMVRDMERSGAVYSAAASRETIAFAAEGLRDKLPEILPIVSEAALTPGCAVHADGNGEWDTATDEIRTHCAVLKKDLETVGKDPNNVVTEAIHSSAFHGNSLGMYIDIAFPSLFLSFSRTDIPLIHRGVRVFGWSSLAACSDLVTPRKASSAAFSVFEMQPQACCGLLLR